MGMTLFIFEDAYEWTASISRPSSETDNFYRTCALDLIAALATEYDLDGRRLSDDFSDLAFSNPVFYLRNPQTSVHLVGTRQAPRSKPLPICLMFNAKGADGQIFVALLPTAGEAKRIELPPGSAKVPAPLPVASARASGIGCLGQHGGAA